MELSELLSGIGLFDGAEADDLAVLASTAEERELTRGDVLFMEGDIAESLFVVRSGRIAIAHRSFDGRESMFAMMTDGDLFGEMSLFDNLGRSALAKALEPSTLVEIRYQELRDLWSRRPELLWRVIELLTRRVRSMDSALADSFYLDVTARTAKHLLELAGTDDEFELPVTQEELAGMVGASRERVNKAISSFARLGWIEQHDRTYRILRRRELEIRAS